MFYHIRVDRHIKLIDSCPIVCQVVSYMVLHFTVTVTNRKVLCLVTSDPGDGPFSNVPK
jgi:hypothetical protein